MQITDIRSLWLVSRNFVISRKQGPSEYIFLHFHDPVELLFHGERVVTRPHCCMIHSPKVEQWFNSENGIIHDWAHITGPVPQRLAAYGLKADNLYYPAESRVITGQLQKLELEFYSNKPFRGQMIDIELEKLFLLLSRMCGEQKQISLESELKARLRNFRIEMFSHVEHEWTVKEMADRVFLSESRFFVVYKSIFGLSPNKDLILARIERARQLLTQPKLSVSQIAELTGYQNECHFVRQFKSVVGVTPGVYRRQNANLSVR